MAKSDSFPSISVTKPLVFDGVDFDFWLNRRETLSCELSDHGIDSHLARVVTEYCCDLEVRPLSRTEVGVKHSVDFVMEPRSLRLNATAEEKSYFITSQKDFYAIPPSTDYPMDAGELLSRELLGRLPALQVRNAPIRHGGHLAKSTIAAAAHCVLEDLSEKQAGPGPYLLELLAALLDINTVVDRDVRLFRKRKMAVEILAQDAQLGTRTLARLVGVDASTVSRWLKDAKFQEQVLSFRKFLARGCQL